jgi:hypothetical protein
MKASMTKSVPIDLNILRKLADREFAVEYVAALEEQMRANEAQLRHMHDTLRRLASNELYSINGSDWHDVGALTRGVQAIASAALMRSHGHDD